MGFFFIVKLFFHSVKGGCSNNPLVLIVGPGLGERPIFDLGISRVFGLVLRHEQALAYP